MYYNEFKGLKLSALGFGTMRLPLMEDGKTIDKEQTARMVKYALDNGVNYFDTAVPYHDGKSEPVIGEILNQYPRDSWYLATKYPGHQHADVFDPAATFEKQLKKCGVDYFDFYLFHNVCENSIGDYMNPKWGMLEYFVEQKRNGRIRHLGMSSHASADLLETILDGPYGKEIEFCQIQLNYLDWTLQDAARKVQILNAHNIPIWVMEPLRGGKLASLEDASVEDAFRWLQGIEGVTMVLSGMSRFEQMVQNVNYFDEKKPCSEDDSRRLMKVAESLKKGVPCTACRYCCAGCAVGLDIPGLIAAYNDLVLGFSFNPVMYVESLPLDLRPSACVGCGQCASICPQGIDVPWALSELNRLYEASPKWSDICRQRNALEQAETT